jgi:serine/threonine protein kinase
VRLCDFGLAQAADGPAMIVGTPFNMSPCTFNGLDDGEKGAYWSLGICLYQLLQRGAWPFKVTFGPREQVRVRVGVRRVCRVPVGDCRPVGGGGGVEGGGM